MRGKGFGKMENIRSNMVGIGLAESTICKLFMGLDFPTVEHLKVVFNFTEADLLNIKKISKMFGVDETLIIQRLNTLAITESLCAAKHSKTVQQWRQMGREWLERQTM